MNRIARRKVLNAVHNPFFTKITLTAKVRRKKHKLERQRKKQGR